MAAYIKTIFLSIYIVGRQTYLIEFTELSKIDEYQLQAEIKLVVTENIHNP